jgi:hypothetical protein
MDQEIFKLLNDIRSTQIEDGRSLAKLEVNQEHLKEEVLEVKNSIKGIEKLDREQNDSLNEHMRRTEINENQMEILRTRLDEINKRMDKHDKTFIKEVKTVVEDVELKKRFKLTWSWIKDNIIWLISVIGSLVALGLITL